MNKFLILTEENIMDNICKDCGKPADYAHSSDEFICGACMGKYTPCTTCGILFDEDDVIKYWTSGNTCPNCENK
jgi:DNA-directed RNA polymerase subunit RPC12/RpoP